MLLYGICIFLHLCFSSDDISYVLWCDVCLERNRHCDWGGWPAGEVWRVGQTGGAC